MLQNEIFFGGFDFSSLQFRKYYDICKAKKDSIYKQDTKKLEDRSSLNKKRKSLIIIVFHHLIRSLEEIFSEFCDICHLFFCRECLLYMST